MTQPIQEPTTDRALQGLAYARDQIFRRPSPNVTPTIPVFRARRITTFQTINTSAETDLLWNDWDTYDADYFETTLSGGLLRSVHCLQEGVYTISCVISIQSLASGSIAIVMNDGYDNAECMVHPAYTFGNGADYDYATIKSYIPFQPDSAPDVAEISFDLAQNSGVSRDTRYGTAFEIAFLGPYNNVGTGS